MATFDRYLITSRKVHLRELSPGKTRTKQIIILIIILHSFIPILFLTIFGMLTYRILTRMLLLMSIAIVLSSIPYCIEHIHYVIIRQNRLK
jgi:hypothetical protein